jgi:N-acetylmuramoyl-L-alanine amidase-like protein
VATNDPTTGMPPMIGRGLSISDWLAYVAGYNFGPVAPSRVVLHHTWVPTVAQWTGQRSMQALQRFYAGKGWTAAPHIFVGPDAIWLFTPLKDVGIHAGTGNSGTSGGRFWYSIGVEMVGDYDLARPSGPVWENVKAVLGGLSRRLGIAPRQLLSLHRDYTNQKSCPGWAVTKDWVFGEIDAWLNNRPPPPAPPPGPIGDPSPEVAALVEALMEQSYARRGEGYNSDWAFHQYAVQNGLGFPIGRSVQLQADGKSYAYQPFARDTLFNEIPNWGDVRRLSALLGGNIPPGGLARALLDATYRAGGAALHPDWAFHQYAVANQLGPPIGESTTTAVDGAQYAYQVFALDTLYNLVPNWADVRRLGALANATAPAQQRLRDALLAQTYRAGGATYHADWAFHQLARSWSLGAPLSDSYRVSFGAAQYAIQVYAADTLYNLVPNWADVRRLSALAAPRPAVLSAEGQAPPAVPRAAAAPYEPAAAPFQIVQYSPAMAMSTAYSSRDGAKIALIVLHSDPGPAVQTLAALIAPGARATAHYYVAREGTIYQVVDDQYAAWHAGMAEWNGREQNINRISLGVVAERGPAGYSDAQLAALAWLVDTLRGRYQLPVGSVVRWGDLDPRRSEDPAGFPWELFVHRLVPGVPANVERH